MCNRYHMPLFFFLHNFQLLATFHTSKSKIHFIFKSYNLYWKFCTVSLLATSVLEKQLKTHYPSIFLHWFEPCIWFLTKQIAKMQILSRKQHWNRQINRKVIFGQQCTASPMTSCIVNVSNWREPANYSIKSCLNRTTFGNDHLQLAENSENDRKFMSSKQKCADLHLEKL